MEQAREALKKLNVFALTAGPIAYSLKFLCRYVGLRLRGSVRNLAL
jgi:hypothetical protein